VAVLVMAEVVEAHRVLPFICWKLVQNSNLTHSGTLVAAPYFHSLKFLASLHSCTMFATQCTNRWWKFRK